MVEEDGGILRWCVIKESEMMLEWAVEQPTEIATTAIDLEFLPAAADEDRGVQNLEFVLQQMRTALMALTSFEANDIVANLRKNPLEAWRRLQKRYDPKRNLLRTIISPGRCSFLELQAGIERWESYVSRHQKKMKDKLDDEIKLAGLESLVPEELEKHLILIPAMGVSSAVHMSNEIARKGTGKQSYGKGKQIKSWSKSEPSYSGKGKSKENKGKSKENPIEHPREPKVRIRVPKAYTKAKHRKRVSQVLKSRSRRRQLGLTLPGAMVGMVTKETMAGVLMNGMMTGGLLDGMKAENKLVTIPQAHFRLEVLILVRAAVNTCSVELWYRRRRWKILSDF